MRFVLRHWLALGMGALICPTMRAQTVDGGTAGRASATRSELEQQAASAEEMAASATVSAKVRAEKQREAAALRARLREGDFEVGDRIVLAVRGDTALSDTISVQPGRTINLPNLPALPLAGVLRSELRSHLVTQIARYVKDTTVRVTPLIRFGVLGEVARPGYYRLPADIPLSDALMAAGGPTPRADVRRMVVRRGSKQLLAKGAVRDAMVAGATLDQLNLGAGDEIVVSARRERGWQTAAQVAALAGVVLSLRGGRVF